MRVLAEEEGVKAVLLDERATSRIGSVVSFRMRLAPMSMVVARLRSVARIEQALGEAADSQPAVTQLATETVRR